LVLAVGGRQSQPITTNEIHSFNLVPTTTSLTLTATITGSSGEIHVSDLYILKESDFTSSLDQVELKAEWQHLLALYATHYGLIKNRKNGPANMLETIYHNELSYLKQLIVDAIPDGMTSVTQEEKWLRK